MTYRFRTLWVSDIHLGTRASRAAELLRFLTSVEADRIYLVGDIIDLERMKNQPMFPDAHVQVVAELFALAKNGTDVIFIPGNQDADFRRFAGTDLMGIPVVLEAAHVTADGQRLLVIHGDILDREVRHGTNLEKFGAAAYRFLLRADVVINRFRRMLGQDYFSMSSTIKGRLRSANEYVHRYETVAARYAIARGFDGIVCGHIHRPRMRSIDGCLYMNDGDWVEHGTALAESVDGSLQILDWRQRRVVAGVETSESTIAVSASA